MLNSVDMINFLLQINEHRINKKYESAINICIRISKKHGETEELCELTADLFYHLAISPGETGINFQNAINWLKKAIAKAPNNPRLHAKLGEYYWLGLVDYDNATREYRHAIQLNPDNKNTFIELASLYGPPDSPVKINEAIQCLEQAVKIDSDDPLANARLGELLFEKGRIQEARQAWIRSLLCSQPLDDSYIELIKTKLKVL